MDRSSVSTLLAGLAVVLSSVSFVQCRSSRPLDRVHVYRCRESGRESGHAVSVSTTVSLVALLQSSDTVSLSQSSPDHTTVSSTVSLSQFSHRLCLSTVSLSQSSRPCRSHSLLTDCVSRPCRSHSLLTSPYLDVSLHSLSP